MRKDKLWEEKTFFTVACDTYRFCVVLHFHLSEGSLRSFCSSTNISGILQYFNILGPIWTEVILTQYASLFQSSTWRNLTAVEKTKEREDDDMSPNLTTCVRIWGRASTASLPAIRTEGVVGLSWSKLGRWLVSQQC